MISGARKARAHVARGWAFFAAVLALALVGGAVAAAAAETRPQARGVQAASLSPFVPTATDPNDKIQLTVERAAKFEPAENPNAVTVHVTIRDADGNVPKVNYGVFAQVFSQFQADEAGGEPPKSDPAQCQQPHYTTNPEIDPGVYRCSYVVDRPDVWTFEVTVNKLAQGTRVVRLAQIQGTFPVNDAVVLAGDFRGLRYVVEGSTFEVFLLQAHFASASVWLLMITVMAFLAVPRLRRMCSVLTLHTLEVRRGFLVSVMWAMFATVLGTGIYLLRTQTAYEAPWSKSAWDNITKLPYASMYFTTLYVKILLFVLMAGASVVLMMEAARQARMAGDSGDSYADNDDEFWGRLSFHDASHDDGTAMAERRPDAAGGAAATAVQAKPRAKEIPQGVSSRTLWACVFVVAAGMGAVGVCVTVLKYTHELIEMLVAFKTVEDQLSK